MKKLLLFFVLLALTTFATFAAADSTELSVVGVGGVLSGSNAGLSLTGQSLFDLGSTIGSLGSISLTTGKLLSGSLGAGAAFLSGGVFTITGNGTLGVHNGVIFAGVFDDLQWKLLTDAHGNHFYDLLGSFTGKWFTGQKVDGAFTLLTGSTGDDLFEGSVKVVSTDITLQIAPLTQVPEPATLTLFGTGLASLGIASWRKFRARKGM